MHCEDPRLARALEPALEVNSGITQNSLTTRSTRLAPPCFGKTRSFPDSILGGLVDYTEVEPLGVMHQMGVYVILSAIPFSSSCVFLPLLTPH
jgi:hypothetical protein